MLAKRLRCSAANGLDTSCKTPAAAGADAEVSRGAVATRGGEAEDTRFDLELAHDLYRRLFPEQVRDFVRGKKLVIAPAPELMGLPWHLLVTEAPPPGWDDRRAERIKAYREARWLFQSHPSIAVLPTIASLRALRGMAPQRSSADRAFLGIGDPAIGRTAMEREAAPMDCRQGEDSIVLAGIDPAGFGPRSAAASPAAIFTGARDERGFALADVDLVRSQPRLPDTRCELMSVAASLESERTDLLLGTDAAETTIRDLDDSGALARYRILHFATHGLLGGELGLGEPGLVLTPPEKADTQDDGILSASEVAALSLAAEWVVLSACNTAAGSGADAEALSGLARAFFYAGAKSLLVSSWPVYSAAAVSITTAAFDAMKDDPKMGRAEAVTRAMRVTLAAASDEHTAHPAYWGPFFLVGEGMR